MSTNFNFFKRFTVSNTDFETTPQILINFKGNPSFSMLNEGTGTLEYSFNGVDVHGDMVPGTASSKIESQFRGVGLIWFRLSSGSASEIRFEASDGELSLGSSGGSGSVGNLGAQVPDDSLATVNALSTSFSTGQLAVTATAQALGSATTYKNGFKLTNLTTSSLSVFVGSSSVTTSTGDELPPGQSIIIPMQNIAQIYVRASGTGSTVSWIGFN